jgi:6-phosphogluconolactonase (cycloisomerase 2 family)
MDEKTIIAGTYTDSGSKGIYRFTLKDGKLSKPELFAEADSPKYLAVSNRLTASIGRFAGACGAGIYDEDGKLLAQKTFETRTSCWIGWHDGAVYTANYHLGTVTKLSWDGENLNVVKTAEIQEKAGCHQVLFHNGQLLVPCLFLNRILIFDEDLNYQGAVIFPDGTGPRHGVFSADGSALYLVSELSNELFVLDPVDWGVRTVLPVLPSGETHVRGTAAVRLSGDGTILYVSTRGQDLVSVIDLQKNRVIQGAYSGGRHPRDFILTDRHILCANRYSDTVVCFEVRDDGTIGFETDRITIPQAVSLAVQK